MNELPQSLYFAEQVRALDARVMKICGVDGAVLMERAAQAVLDALRRRWPPPGELLVLCGGGNNGGDGYAVARLAAAAGYTVNLCPVVAPGNDLCAAQCRAWEDAAGGATFSLAEVKLKPGVPLVDAVFGTGLRRPVAEPCASLFRDINRMGLPVLAVDVPSGLDSNSGCERGAALRAALTVTFIGMKTGLLTGRGREYCGDIVFDALAAPDEAYVSVPCAAQRLHPELFAPVLRRRPRDAHKGLAGHVLVVGGAQGSGGAVHMAAQAACRTGSGLVTVCCESDAQNRAIVAALPECMSVSGLEQLRRRQRRFNARVIGPGLGAGDWGLRVMAALLEDDEPMVLDADGLNLLAREPCRRRHWVLTPHPGEAARLLGVDTAAVQADRFAAAREIAARYGGVCVLKGSGTLIVADGAASSPGAWLCSDGNHGMAGGGMGDVLSGVIGGLLAQGYTPPDGACLGVYLHANAADAAAREGGAIGLMATDLAPHLRRLHNRLLERLP